MKKSLYIFLLTLILSPATTYSYCEPLEETSSQTFKILEADVDVDFCHDQNPIAYAYASLDALEQKLSCKFQFSYKALNECAEIDPDAPNSMVCYLEAEVGSFIISFDYFENVNISFSRWD